MRTTDTLVPSAVDATARVDACTNLADLCDTLNALEAELSWARRRATALTRDGDYEWPALTAAERQAIEDLRLADLVDLTALPTYWSSLPTFGGDAPADTTGIWSWDRDRVLVGDGGDVEIVERTVACAYCGEEHTAAEDREVPASDDDEAWERLAASHGSDCEWIETRAHRRA